MSKYGTAETNIKDVACLVDALIEMGWKKEQISVFNTPQQLIDFRGRATHYLDANGDKAEVIIRRQHLIGAANDMGFRRNPQTGRFEAIISQYDRKHYDDAWRKRLEVNYAEKFCIKTAQRQGLKFAGYGQKREGKRELLFVQA
jgi:Protein of unknown function (DUF1257)